MVEKKVRITSPFIYKNRFFNDASDFKSKHGFIKIYNSLYIIVKEIIIILLSLRQRFLDLFKDHSHWKCTANVPKQSLLPIITWIGHSSFLIQIENTNILTDPVFGNITFLFKRIFQPGIEIQNLPSIDYVLISHNHRDHVDKFSINMLKTLFPKIKFLVPSGTKNWFVKQGISHVMEFEWWKSIEHNLEHTFLNKIKFTFLPAYHWSGRNFFDSNCSLWGSWMIESLNFKIYFGGDTAYWGHFKDIGNYFTNIDVAILPIAPCSPRILMKGSHMDSYEACKALIDLNATSLIPMHWGTFYFGCDGIDTPVQKLISAWKRLSLQSLNKKLTLLAIGEQFKTQKEGFTSELNIQIHSESPSEKVI